MSFKTVAENYCLDDEKLRDEYSYFVNNYSKLRKVREESSPQPIDGLFLLYKILVILPIGSTNCVETCVLSTNKQILSYSQFIIKILSIFMLDLHLCWLYSSIKCCIISMGKEISRSRMRKILSENSEHPLKFFIKFSNCTPVNTKKTLILNLFRINSELDFEKLSL